MKFIAYPRKLHGTGASRRLRKAGRFPAVVYGADMPAMSIELNHNDLFHAIKKEKFHSSILEMELENSTHKVLLRDIQMHPFRQQIVHLDFLRVNANTKLHMKIPLHYSGQELSPAVKTDACLINHVVTELEISCLPADLPEYIKIDLSGLKKGASLHLSSVVLPSGVTAVTHGKHDPVLVAVVEQAVVADTPASEAGAEASAAAPAKAAAGKDAKPAAAAKDAKPAAKK